MKRYIIPKESVPVLAEAIALQDSKIFLEKDDKSSFYIAHIADDIHLPSKIKALEISDSHPRIPTDTPDDMGKRFLDLRLCIEIPNEIDKSKLETVLYKEISRTLKDMIQQENDESD
ncbi:MAG: hypothetical protein HRT88_12655 [Lentisphaeraceae bacterium]|nr:hypothetical protein [Lentisphaeraceae bacterium]